MSEEELIYVSHGAGGDWFVVRAPDGGIGAEVRSLLVVRRTVYALHVTPRQPAGQRIIRLEPVGQRRGLRRRVRDYVDNPEPSGWWEPLGWIAIMLMLGGVILLALAVRGA